MRRRRLFWKYTTFFVLLVTAELLASGITELYFSYQENQAALVALQREKALAAASQIEGFIKEIERQMGWVTQPQRSPAGTTLEQRRFAFFRLQRQVPAITEVSYIDAAGRPAAAARAGSPRPAGAAARAPPPRGSRHQRVRPPPRPAPPRAGPGPGPRRPRGAAEALRAPAQRAGLLPSLGLMHSVGASLMLARP